MAHPIHRVTSFDLVGPHTLQIHFEDGVGCTIDFQPVLRGELYGPLRDPAVFSRVQLDNVAHTLVWPNGADFDPATLHDWPQVAGDFIAMAERWVDTSNESSDDVGQKNSSSIRIRG